MRGKGFTLVELLVTISILAILSSIALISYGNIQKNARDGKRKSDLATIQAAMEQYHADLGYYPASPLPNAGSALSNGMRVYLSKIPGDNDGLNYSYTAKPDGCNNSTTNCTNYCLYAIVEVSSNQTQASQCGLTSGNSYSAVFGETTATFSFDVPESTGYTIDASTLPDMSWDVYGNFASGANSPIVLNNAHTKWLNVYTCNRTLYWRINNGIGFISPIQSTTVVCGGAPESASSQYQVQAP